MANELWTQPSESVASRRPPLRSRGSCRGSFINPLTRREIVYESALERDAVHILLADRAVHDVVDQPKAVTYEDNGRVHGHTFDFVASMRDGKRAAIAVKPSARVASSGLYRAVDLIRKRPPPGFADTFAICTEQNLDRASAYNARLILRARRTRCDDDVASLARIVAKLRGAVQVRALLRDLPDRGRAFLALVCLIDDGVLERAGSGRLGHDSLVRRPTHS